MDPLNLPLDQRELQGMRTGKSGNRTGWRKYESINYIKFGGLRHLGFPIDAKMIENLDVVNSMPIILYYIRGDIAELSKTVPDMT
jgi:hypothetical protein